MTNLFKSEQKYLCNFSIPTTIYDKELPEKIKEKLSAMDLPIDQSKIYSMNVSFDKKVYGDKDFYIFPVERKDWQIEQLKNQSPQDQMNTVISDVLSQQLDNICRGIEQFHIPFRSTSIIGEDFDHAARVDVAIYEDGEEPFGTSKKNSKKQKTLVARCIIPDHPWMINKFAQLMAERVLQEMREERRKEIQKIGHVPNLISAEKLFTALGTEILQEENETLSLDALVNRMISHSYIQNDWPLIIRGDQYMNFGEKTLTPDENIDCPEYLVYTRKKSDWTIEKVADLDAAKTKILYYGLNKKGVKNMIVLHHLKPVLFDLFVENNGEIRPVAKNEASSHKKILLSWNKNLS